MCTRGACVRTCPTGTHAVGAACVADGGPRPLTPISLGDVTQLRPRFSWNNPSNADGAVIEICTARGCDGANLVQTIMAARTGTTPVTSAAATAALSPARTYYWRARVMVGSVADAGDNSPAWLFHTPRANRGTPQTSVRPHLDVNADGYDDMAVAAPGAGAGAGRVEVYLGGASGLSTTVHRSLTGATGARFGTSVAPAGDVNGDGYGDLIVGAPGASSGSGAVTLYLGSATGLAMTAGFTATGAAAGDALGATVTGAGDVDLDGYGDLVAGAPGASSRAGAAVWYRGAASVTALPATTLSGGGGANAQFGLTLAGAGDVNGDGYSDVLVGEPGFNSNQGRLHTFNGGAAGLPATTTVRLLGGSVGDRFTEGLAGAGDLNADGYSDAVASAPLTLTDNVGGFNVLVGAAGGLTTASVPAGNTANAGFGRALAGVGDVNGDNRDDVLVGLPFDATRAGRVLLVSGPALLATGTFGYPARLFEQSGDAPYSALGAAVAGLGDVNGDGFGDAAFSAPGENSDSLGRVYVLRGSTTAPTSPVAAFVTSAGQGDRFGAAIASLDAIVPADPPPCVAGQVRCTGVCIVGTSCGTVSCTPGTQCRAAAAGGCDVAETCTAMGTCPADGFAPSSTVCRAAVTASCDPAETCTGSGAACPADVTSSCTSGQTCTAGVCMAMGCPTGQTLCGGSCIDTQTSPTQCGACGNACPAGNACTAGVCAPVRLVLERTTNTSLAGNSSGGTLFDDLCDPGEAVVGIDGFYTSSIDVLSVLCRPVALSFPGGVPTVTTTGIASRTLLRGTYQGPLASMGASAQCPDNQVVVGFRGFAGSLVDSLEMRCAPIVATPVPGGLVFSLGTVTPSMLTGGTGGSPTGTISCGAGQIGGGGQIRASRAIDAFGLSCFRVVGVP